MIKLSAALISFNEEHNIRRALRALDGLADEIVVVDSFSTDKTLEIAAEFGARIFQEPWAGYVAQKNSCLGKCLGEWVLSIDCDEEVSPELAASIKGILESGVGVDGYLLNRRTFYMGRLLKHAWQPDRKLRFFRRGKGRWGGSDPHESLLVDGKVERLGGDLVHHSYRDFNAHMEQTRKLAALMAGYNFRKGKKSGALSMLFKPPFALFKRLFLQKAVLDGAPGLMAALSTAFYMYMKNAYLWEMWQDKEENKKLEP